MIFQQKKKEAGTKLDSKWSLRHFWSPYVVIFCGGREPAVLTEKITPRPVLCIPKSLVTPEALPKYSGNSGAVSTTLHCLEFEKEMN